MSNIQKINLSIICSIAVACPAIADTIPHKFSVQAALPKRNSLRAQDLYYTQALGLTNPLAAPSSWFLTSQQCAYLAAITRLRASNAGIQLLSDTGSTIGQPYALRGWGITKQGSAANLAFTYENSDLAGQASIPEYIVMELDGVNHKIQLPAPNTQIVFADDTNLYRSAADTLKTDDNLVVATLTPNTVVTTDSNDTLVSSSITATEVGYLGGTTAPVQSQLDGKVAKSGDVMTGVLHLTAGSAANPSAQFSGSTNTGISAATTNTLSFDTNGTERMHIDGSGNVVVNGLNNAGVVHTDSTGKFSTSSVVNGDIANATITNAKLAAISSSNIANDIVVRDSLGNFAATTITANLTGSASSNVAKSGDTMTGTLTHSAGSAANPPVQFSGSTNTGISAATANTLSFDANGVEQMSISSSAIDTIAPLIVKNIMCNQAIQVAAPASSGTVTTLSSTSTLLLIHTANRTNVTIVFPPNPTNGQFFTIMLGTSNSITLINTGGTGGATIINGITGLNPASSPTAAANGNAITYIYFATSGTTSNAWYRFSR